MDGLLVLPAARSSAFPLRQHAALAIDSEGRWLIGLRRLADREVLAASAARQPAIASGSLRSNRAKCPARE